MFIRVVCAGPNPYSLGGGIWSSSGNGRAQDMVQLRFIVELRMWWSSDYGGAQMMVELKTVELAAISKRVF